MPAASANMYTRAEAELAAIEAERASLPSDRPLLFFADAAGKELQQLRGTLQVQADKAREEQYALRMNLQTSHQREERAISEGQMLARQLDESHAELTKAKQVAADAQLKAEALQQEVNLVKNKTQNDKSKLQEEFDTMRKQTNDLIAEASSASMVKAEMEAKLRNIMDGATTKEKELEVALFNTVHECAQVKKEHQDAMDEMAMALAHQRNEFEAKIEQVQDEYSRVNRDLEMRLSEEITSKQLKTEEVERLESLCGEQGHENSKRQLSLTQSLTATKEGLGRLAAENEHANRELQTVSLEARMTKREAESALREAAKERTELESRIASLKIQLDHQAKLFEQKLAFAAEQTEAKLSMAKKEHEATVSMLTQEHEAKMERTCLDSQNEKADLQAFADKKRREVEALLRESNQARKEQAEELDMLRRAVLDKDEGAKKLSSMTQYQITAAAKSKERAELEKDVAERRTQSTLEESEMMRRVLESALRESDSVAKSLREELDQMRRDSAAKVNEARAQAMELNSMLEAKNQELNSVSGKKEQLELQSREDLLSQSKITERVQLELASSRKELDRAKDARSEAMKKAAATAQHRDQVSSDLSTTRKQLDSTVHELDSAERRAQAIHREKLETVARLREEIVRERGEVERVGHEKELTAVDLRRAAEEREFARKELASTMRLNRELAADKEEAQLLSEGLKYRMSEVSAGQGAILSGVGQSPRYRPSGSRAADLSPRIHAPQPSSRYYA